jgi:hypothetical protein
MTPTDPLTKLGLREGAVKGLCALLKAASRAIVAGQGTNLARSGLRASGPIRLSNWVSVGVWESPSPNAQSARGAIVGGMGGPIGRSGSP